MDCCSFQTPHCWLFVLPHQLIVPPSPLEGTNTGKFNFIFQVYFLPLPHWSIISSPYSLQEPPQATWINFSGQLFHCCVLMAAPLLPFEQTTGKLDFLFLQGWLFDSEALPVVFPFLPHWTLMHWGLLLFFSGKRNQFLASLETCTHQRAGKCKHGHRIN